MLYQFNYDLFGKLLSIGDLEIRYTNILSSISDVGDIGITYDLLHRIVTIDGQNCTYKGWLSLLSSVGNIEIARSWGQIKSIGDLNVCCSRSGRLQSIGNLKVSYGNFGKMTEINTVGDSNLTHQQKIALTVILLEIQENLRNSPL